MPDVAAAKGAKASGVAFTGNVANYFRDVLSTVKDGIRRYEVAEPECQARLVCELHQKAVGRSLKSWATTLLDVFRVEDYLESTAFGARTKSAIKDIYRAARTGMTEQDCAMAYSKCPVSISVEPLKNSILNKLVRGQSRVPQKQSQNKHHPQPLPVVLKASQVYGTTVTTTKSPAVSTVVPSREATKPTSKASPTTRRISSPSSSIMRQHQTTSSASSQQPSLSSHHSSQQHLLPSKSLTASVEQTQQTQNN